MSERRCYVQDCPQLGRHGRITEFLRQDQAKLAELGSPERQRRRRHRVVPELMLRHPGLVHLPRAFWLVGQQVECDSEPDGRAAGAVVLDDGVVVPAPSSRSHISGGMSSAVVAGCRVFPSRFRALLRQRVVWRFVWRGDGRAAKWWYMVTDWSEPSGARCMNFLRICESTQSLATLFVVAPETWS